MSDKKTNKVAGSDESAAAISRRRFLTRTITAGVELKWSHSNGMNFPFADGHVERIGNSSAMAAWSSTTILRGRPWRRPTGYPDLAPDE